MVAVDRRLDLLTSELTARERATLQLRAWCEGETPDERLTRYCPPQDKPEVDRICGAVQRVNNEAYGHLVILLEWAATTEASLHSYRILCLYQARVAALEAVARKPVPPLPDPWDTNRIVPIAWGRLVNVEQGPAADWDMLRKQWLRSLRDSITFRWRDVLAFEEVFREVERAMVTPLMTEDVRTLLDALTACVLRMKQGLEGTGETMELPADKGEHGGSLEAAIDWETIRGIPKVKHPREWMHMQQQEELEAWEREQAETLRSAG